MDVVFFIGSCFFEVVFVVIICVDLCFDDLKWVVYFVCGGFGFVGFYYDVIV